MLKAKILIVHSTVFSLPRTAMLFIYLLFKIQSRIFTDLFEVCKSEKELTNYFNVIT